MRIVGEMTEMVIELSCFGSVSASTTGIICHVLTNASGKVRGENAIRAGSFKVNLPYNR